MKKKLIIAALVIFVGLPLLLVVISTATTTEAATPDEPTVIVIFSPTGAKDIPRAIKVDILKSAYFVEIVQAVKTIFPAGGQFTIISPVDIHLPEGVVIEAGVPKVFGF